MAIPQGRSELDRVVDIDGGLAALRRHAVRRDLSGPCCRHWICRAVVCCGSVMRRAMPVWRRASAAFTSAGHRHRGRHRRALYHCVCGATTRWLAVNCRAGSVLQLRRGRRHGRLSAPAEPGGRSISSPVKSIDSDGLRARPLVSGSTIYVYRQQRQAGSADHQVVLTMLEEVVLRLPQAAPLSWGLFDAHSVAPNTSRCLAAAFVFSEITKWRAAWFP